MKKLTIAICCLFLAGCATPARVGQMVAKPIAVSNQNNDLKSNLSVGSVGGGEETNPLWVSNVSAADFSQALNESLRGHGLLADKSAVGKYLLAAHLNALQQPLFGIDMTVTAPVSYTLTEKATGKEVAKFTIATPFTATFSDAALGVERLKIANEGAVKENLTQLILRLYSLSVDKVAAINVVK